MRESQWEAKWAAKVKARKLRAIKMDNWVGIPDRMVICPGGRVLWIEMKQPGEEPRESQLRFHRYLESMGHTVRVAHSPAEADQILDDFLRLT